MGASLAVVIGMAWFGLWTQTSMIWVAVLGAAGAALFVYVVGSLGRGGATPLKLALAGAATSAAFASFITAIMLPRNDIAGNIRSWQIGGVGGASFEVIRQGLPFLVVGFAICLLSARSLNSLALGDEVASGLGERVAVVRAVAALGAVLLCGAATAIAGPIGFVGFGRPAPVPVVDRYRQPLAATVFCADRCRPSGRRRHSRTNLSRGRAKSTSASSPRSSERPSSSTSSAVRKYVSCDHYIRYSRSPRSTQSEQAVSDEVDAAAS